MRAASDIATRPTWATMISLGLAAALVLAACGGERGTSPTAGPSRVPPEPEATTVPTSTTTTTTVKADERPPALIRYGDDGIVLVDEHGETRLVDGRIGWVASDRVGGIVFTEWGDGDEWSRRDAATWWLPAGSDSPRRVAVSGVPDTDEQGRPVLVGRPAAGIGMCDDDQSPIVRHDLATGLESLVGCRDEMGDAWFRLTSAGGGRTAVTLGYDVLNLSAAGAVTILDQDGEVLDPPGNAYGCGCPATPDPWRCDVYSLLSPDGRLIATWYRPDHIVAVEWEDPPPEWAEVHAQWIDRLDAVTATVTVRDLDTGLELYTGGTSARTRLADFDGRRIVLAPRELDRYVWVDVRDAPWTVIDIIGVVEPRVLDGPVALVP